MKRYVSVLLLLLETLALPAFAQEAEQIPVEVIRVSERVAIFRVQDAPSTNVIALKSMTGIVVVDSGLAPPFAAAIRRAVEQEFGPDIAYLINTHGHTDHTFGNQVFADVPIIASSAVAVDMSEAEARRANTVSLLRQRVAALGARLESLDPDSEATRSIAGQATYYQAAAEGLAGEFELTRPTITFSEDMTLALGDMTLELMAFGFSHSRGDILIWCPEEAVLLTGDVFYSGDLQPYIDTERLAFLPRWIDVLSRVLAVAPEQTRVIAGHEDAIPLAGLRDWSAIAEEKVPEFKGRSSALTRMKEIHELEGAEAAAAALKEMQNDPDSYFMLHPELDTYAYRLMLQDELEDALVIFQALAEIFPENDVAFDSLGEVYVRQENIEAAIKSFEAALRLNPDNQNAARRLGELKAPPPSEL